MTLAADILNDAALYAGVGDQYNPQDGITTQTYLRSLNDIVDEFCTDEQIVFDVHEYVLPVVAGSNAYTLGPANVGIVPLMAQPPQIIETFSMYDANGLSYICSLIGPREWAGIVFKAAPGRPRYGYFEYGWPNSTLFVFPTPSFATDTIHIWAGEPLSQFTAPSNTLVMPAGYSMMLKTQLALRICELNKLDVPPSLNKRAVKAFNRAAKPNNRIHLLSTNLPGGLGDRWRFNIYTGEWQ